jgi:hypothetical protein
LSTKTAVLQSVEIGGRRGKSLILQNLIIYSDISCFFIIYVIIFLIYNAILCPKLRRAEFIFCKFNEREKDMSKKIIQFFKKNIRPILFIGDIISILVAFVAASYLKFDAQTLFDGWFAGHMYYILAVDITVTLGLFLLFKIYRFMWQFVVISDYMKLVKSFILSKLSSLI